MEYESETGPLMVPVPARVVVVAAEGAMVTPPVSEPFTIKVPSLRFVTPLKVFAVLVSVTVQAQALLW